MRTCGRCEGHLRRIHRTFVERFTYMAIFECRDCHTVSTAPRRYMFHLGEFCRCPRCGTFRVSKLKKRDQIDPLDWGFLHTLERLFGGRLFHCRYCRVQFYDRRGLAPESVSRRGAAAAMQDEGQAGSG
jgi:hypothetical protein